MLWYRIAGNLKLAKGKIKQKWGELTSHRREVVSGKRDQLVGKIQACYGIPRDDAEGRIKAMEEKGFDCGERKSRHRPYAPATPTTRVATFRILH